MIYPELTFYPGHHSDRLAARLWRVEHPVADVIYLHGIVSHGGWYETSCAHLAANGLQVHFLDRRGSGLNAQHCGDVDHWTTWITDVVNYIEQLETGRPKILLGISWGGILASSIARKYSDLLCGLGLICPGLYSHKSANRFQRTALRLANLLGLNSKKVQVPLQSPSLFTNSGRWQQYIAEDPFALRKITINFAINNLALLQNATEAPEEIELPVLLMLASSDPITDNAATLQFVNRLASHNKTIITYPDASHTLEFEESPSQYFGDLSQWCQRISETT